MTTEARNWRLIALVAIGALVLLLLISFARWVVHLDKNIVRGINDKVVYPPIEFAVASFFDLPGWNNDRHFEAVPVFLRSCDRLENLDPDSVANSSEALGVMDDISLAGYVRDWLPVCEKARDVTAITAQTFFEESFIPVRIAQPAEDTQGRIQVITEGRFTGYFEPGYPANGERTGEFSHPVLTRPDDLVMVDLGTFRENLAGKRIAGRVKDGRLIPYADHEKIISDGLDTGILAWMNPNDLLFLQIQGSGRLLLEDKELRVGYAAQNGHEYTAIGGPLIQSGAITREDMSMQAIYHWLETVDPEEAAALRHQNASYVFFRELDDLPDPALGPLGAQSVQLTAGRSLAVDRRYHAMGVPVWIDLPAEGEDGEALQRLVIAQDTGGAIKGPVRGDLYIGSGRQAGEVAGVMNRIGQLYVLVPNSVAERLEKAAHGQTPS